MYLKIKPQNEIMSIVCIKKSKTTDISALAKTVLPLVVS